MSTLLHLDASPRGDSSVCRQLSSSAAKARKHKNPRGRIIEQAAGHKRALAISDEPISQVLEADEIIIGTPTYNFAIPAVLRAWIAHVVRAGKTFQYTASDPEGLAKERKVPVAVAGGGKYDEAPGMATYNYEVPYQRYILGFIGITDATVVHARGTVRVAQGQVSNDEFLAPFLKTD
jgi:FMN-dependent NADH-azoreductase